MGALFFCVATGIFWGVATLVARYMSVSVWMMAILISAGQFLAMLPIMPGQSFTAAGTKTIAIGIGAGLINGLGLLAYYQLVAGANQGLWELSRVAPIAMVLVPIVITIGARFMFDEPFSANKIAGIALACVAIWLLE
jgi:drug/metabolite transporter (DMT)-like permease